MELSNRRGILRRGASKTKKYVKLIILVVGLLFFYKLQASKIFPSGNEQSLIERYVKETLKPRYSVGIDIPS